MVLYFTYDRLKFWKKGEVEGTYRESQTESDATTSEEKFGQSQIDDDTLGL